MLRSARLNRAAILCCLSTCLLPSWAGAEADASAFASSAAPLAEQWLKVGGLTRAQLQVLRAKLASADTKTRLDAIEALSHLTTDSLPAIEQRLQERAGERVDNEEAKVAIAAFRHAVGSTRADDEVDIAPGVEAVLSKERSRTTVAMAETLLLLRSLEAMATREAGLAMAHIVDLDGNAWRWEMWRVQRRAGMWLLPALIELRSHSSARVKRWAARGVRALDMDDPRRATSIEDHHLAAQVVRAYASPLDFQAMPTLVRLVQDEQLQVREAARWAVAQFGKNAIWQVRELYEELTGQQANRNWGAERSAQELYTVIDRERIERASNALAEGMQAYVAGDLALMQARFDAVLAGYPNLPERGKMAAGYAALGAQELAEGRFEEAEQAYQRAVRLEANERDRQALEARLTLVRSERALHAGLVDLAGYERALALDPSLQAAEQRLDRLTGNQRKRQLAHRRWAAAGALLVLLTLVVLLARRRATPADDGAEVVEEPLHLGT